VRAVVAESSFASIRATVHKNFRDATHLPSFPFATLVIWMVERRWSVRADRVAPEREIGGRDDCAVLLIHAENDRVVSVQDAHVLFGAARGPKELWLIPDAGHALAYLSEREAYAERVCAFFDRWLPADAPPWLPETVEAPGSQPRPRADATIPATSCQVPAGTIVSDASTGGGDSWRPIS
jgi:hypothetical protein